MQFPVTPKSFAIFFAMALVASSPNLSFAGSEDTNRFGANLLFTGLTYHPGGGEHDDYPRKLDAAAYWVLQLGAETDLDWYLHKYVILRGSTALIKDCADVWSGFFHVGPHLNLPIGSRFVFRVGIGPTLVWRQNWYGVVNGYHGDSFYGKDTTSTFQTKFLWYGGNLDFEWKVRNNMSLIYSNIPGWPHVITSSLGARYSF